MQRMSSTCCCIQIIVYVAKCIYKKLFSKPQSQDNASHIENHKLFYVTWCMHRCTSLSMLHVYQRNFNRKQMFYSCVEALASSDRPGLRPRFRPRLNSAIFRTSSVRPKVFKIRPNPRLTEILLNSAESPVSVSAEQYKANIYLVIDLIRKQLSNYYKTQEVDKQPCIRRKLTYTSLAPSGVSCRIDDNHRH